MCGRYALHGPISRHRKNRPIDELPEWYPGLVDRINARPMRFNVAPTDVMPIVGTSREGAITIRELRWGLAPVMLAESAWDAWLSGEPADAADVLKAVQEPRLAYYPVPKAVGSPKNDAPNLVEALSV